MLFKKQKCGGGPRRMFQNKRLDSFLTYYRWHQQPTHTCLQTQEDSALWKVSSHIFSIPSRTLKQQYLRIEKNLLPSKSAKEFPQNPRRARKAAACFLKRKSPKRKNQGSYSCLNPCVNIQGADMLPFSYILRLLYQMPMKANLIGEIRIPTWSRFCCLATSYPSRTPHFVNLTTSLSKHSYCRAQDVDVVFLHMPFLYLDSKKQ